MSSNLLSTIFNPIDLRKLKKSQLPTLAKELRDFIIDIVAIKTSELATRLYSYVKFNNYLHALNNFL